MMALASVFIPLFAFCFKHCSKFPFRNFRFIAMLLPAVLQGPFGIFLSSGTEAVWTRAMQLMAVLIPELFWITWVDTAWSQQLFLSQFSFIASHFWGGRVFQKLFLPFDLLLALQRHLNGLPPPDLFEK